MKIISLYNKAQSLDIPIFAIDTSEAKSMSAMDYYGNCFVAFDPMKIDTSAEEKVLLSHELGHCATGSLYNTLMFAADTNTELTVGLSAR